MMFVLPVEPEVLVTVLVNVVVDVTVLVDVTVVVVDAVKGKLTLARVDISPATTPRFNVSPCPMRPKVPLPQHFTSPMSRIAQVWSRYAPTSVARFGSEPVKPRFT